ncbi:MAG: NUDIX domain-containing protein, partial [Verrucomicrobia bacterium]|nr:NUDIX domain-containing protein [Verrucomicrobiota bacterium]
MPNASQSTGRKNDSPAASALSVLSQAGIGSDETGTATTGLGRRWRCTRSFLFCPIRNAPQREDRQANTLPRRKSTPESAYAPLPVATRTGFAAHSPPMVLPHKIATLLYCFDADGRLLLLERTQEPNLGKWSPPGGKVHTDRGESPYACACREANEEMELTLKPSELHLTGLISEDGYEGSTHWYIFLFEVLPRLAKLPPPCREGRFGFFDNAEMVGL